MSDDEGSNRPKKKDDNKDDELLGVDRLIDDLKKDHDDVDAFFDGEDKDAIMDDETGHNKRSLGASMAASAAQGLGNWVGLGTNSKREATKKKGSKK